MCQITFTSNQFAYDHVHGEAHQKIVRGLKNSRPRLHQDRLPGIPEDKLSNDLTCAICNVASGSLTDFETHLQGSKHQSAISRRNIISNGIINPSKEPQSFERYANASIPLTSINIIEGEQGSDVSDVDSISNGVDTDISQHSVSGAASNSNSSGSKCSSGLTCPTIRSGVYDSILDKQIDILLRNQETASNSTSSGSTSSSGHLTYPSTGSVLPDSILDKQPN